MSDCNCFSSEKRDDMQEHVLVGFGFGPIQSGLFVSEAFKSGNFSRMVIAEIDQNLVDSVRPLTLIGKIF